MSTVAIAATARKPTHQSNVHPPRRLVSPAPARPIVVINIDTISGNVSI